MKKLIKVIDKKNWFIIFFALLSIVFQSICNILQAQYIGEMITSSNSGINNMLVTKIVITLFGSVIFGILGVFLATTVASNYVYSLRKTTFAKIQTFSYQDIDSFSTSSLVTRMTNDMQIIFTGLYFIFSFLVRGITMFIFGISYSTSVSGTEYSLIYAVLVPLFLIVILVIGRFSYPYFMKTQKNVDAVNRQSRETVLGIRVIKSFNLEEKQKGIFNEKSENLMTSSTKAFIYSGLLSPIIQFLVNVSVIVVLIIAGANISSGNLGDVISFILVLQRVLFGLIITIIAFFQIFSTIPSFKRSYEILKWEPSVKYDKDSKEIISKGEIEFKNVYYSFSEKSEPLLKNINIKINPKEKIGVIGKTGSGKSTLVSLMSRLYDVTSGEIFIDGVNIKNFSFNEINKNIAMAFQDVILFSGTIKYNIAMGIKDDLNPEEQEKAIIESAKAAEAWEFIQSKDDKFNYYIEQRGKNLSGGQKQRVSIARTLAKKSLITIFDDSTSALDNVTEKKVRNNMKEKFNATTIIVAQRISSIEDMDKIIVLDNGEIVGFDTHNNLIMKNGIYRDIALSQWGETKFKEITENSIKN
ncbi:MAG: ABC transporter ATP-binding protein [Metamycoplasmataceae bacterium]